MTATATNRAVAPGTDRSPVSLALTLASAAERVRTDPEENFRDGAARAAAQVLRDRLDSWLNDTIDDDARLRLRGPAVDRRG